jgi:hypothetical protein
MNTTSLFWPTGGYEYGDVPSFARMLTYPLSALLFILLSPLAIAQEAGCENPDTAQIYEGTPHWLLVKEAHVNIDKIQQVRVRQLRSRETTGCSGAGNDLHSLRVLIDQDGHLLYQRDSGAKTQDFWLGRPFIVRELMSESAPQVIFDSGYMAASDGTAHQHIVPLTGPQKFTDVGIPAFDTSWRHSIGWFGSQTGPFVVMAVPIIGDPDSDPDGFCHGCPHPYRYLMYRWQETGATWKVVGHAKGTRKFDGSVDPLVEDRTYISERLP